MLKITTGKNFIVLAIKENLQSLNFKNMSRTTVLMKIEKSTWKMKVLKKIENHLSSLLDKDVQLKTNIMKNVMNQTMKNLRMLTLKMAL